MLLVTFTVALTVVAVVVAIGNGSRCCEAQQKCHGNQVQRFFGQHRFS
jgi:hypothetical protein